MILGKEVDGMSTIKPIQATPEVTGKDAVGLLKQVNAVPTKKAMDKNKTLRSILVKVTKA